MENIKNFFKKLFSKTKKLEIETSTENNQLIKNNYMRDSLRIDTKRLELIQLQEKFEEDDLDLCTLPKTQLQELILLYEDQISNLNNKIKAQSTL